MDIQGNLSWLFSQPIAFWITAVFLAIFANFLTIVLQKEYVNSISKFKYGKIKFALKTIQRAIPYIKKGKTFELLVMVQFYVTTLLIVMLSLLIVMPIYAIIIPVSYGYHLNIITQSLLTLLLTPIMYLTNRATSSIRIIRNLYRQIDILEKYTTEPESLISFAAKITHSSVDDIRLVLDSDSRLSLQLHQGNG